MSSSNGVKADDRPESKVCNVSECNAWKTGDLDFCHHHKGMASTPPEGNQNAQTHALYSDRDAYFQDLSDGEQEWIFDFTHDLLDRQRDMVDREPDMFDKEALKNIAIDFHRVATANGWFRERGLAPDDYKITPQGELVQAGKKLNEWAAEIRQYNESIYRRMKKHGLLYDPESQQAKAMSDLAEEWARGLQED